MRQRPGHVPGLSHFPEKRWGAAARPRSSIDAAKGSRSKGGSARTPRTIAMSDMVRAWVLTSSSTSCGRGSCSPEDVVAIAARLATGRDLWAGRTIGAAATALALEVLARRGFKVVPARGAPARSDIPVSSEDREWSEGRPNLVAHLKRERQSRATRAIAARRYGRVPLSPRTPRPSGLSKRPKTSISFDHVDIQYTVCSKFSAGDCMATFREMK